MCARIFKNLISALIILKNCITDCNTWQYFSVQEWDCLKYIEYTKDSKANVISVQQLQESILWKCSKIVFYFSALFCLQTGKWSTAVIFVTVINYELQILNIFTARKLLLIFVTFELAECYTHFLLFYDFMIIGNFKGNKFL